MGRHSAPDGEGAGVAVSDLLGRSGSHLGVGTRPGRRGRHSAADEDEGVDLDAVAAPAGPDAPATDRLAGAGTTAVLPTLEPPEAEAPAGTGVAAGVSGGGEASDAAAPATAAAGATGREAVAGKTGTHADLALLRTDAGLRARCIAAVVVPFVLFAVVLIVLGRVDAFLLWVWIPTVLAGVLVGTFLDIAHRRIERQG